MSIFPANPNQGDTYSGFIWDGVAWTVLGQSITDVIPPTISGGTPSSEETVIIDGGTP